MAFEEKIYTGVEEALVLIRRSTLCRKEIKISKTEIPCFRQQLDLLRDGAA